MNLKTTTALSLTLAGVEAVNQRESQELFMWPLGPIHISDEEPLLSSDESYDSDDPNIIDHGGPPYTHGDFLEGEFESINPWTGSYETYSIINEVEERQLYLKSAGGVWTAEYDLDTGHLFIDEFNLE